MISAFEGSGNTYTSRHAYIRDAHMRDLHISMYVGSRDLWTCSVDPLRERVELPLLPPRDLDLLSPQALHVGLELGSRELWLHTIPAETSGWVRHRVHGPVGIVGFHELSLVENTHFLCSGSTTLALMVLSG